MDTVMTGVIPDEDTAAITDCIERGVKEVVGTSSYSLALTAKLPWWNRFPWRRWLSAIRKCRFNKIQIESTRKVVEAMSANVLVVHGGGPTAVINASLYGVVEEAKSSGSIGRVYGAIGGSEGILKESFLDLMQYPEEKLSLLLQTPATAIGSSRYALKQEDYNAWRESSGNMEYGMYSSTGETEPWIPAAASLRRAGERTSMWWEFPRPLTMTLP